MGQKIWCLQDVIDRCYCQDNKISCGDVFKASKSQLSCKSKQCLTKALIRNLKKTSQSHLRSVSKTLLRQLTDPFLRYVKQQFSKEALSRAHFRVSNSQFLGNSGFSGLILPNFCNFFRVFQKKNCHFYGPDFCLRIRCITTLGYLMIISILLTERQISESPWKSEKAIFQYYCITWISELSGSTRLISGFLDSARHPAFARQISIVFS